MSERLREDVQKANGVGVGQPITVSVGVSAHPDHGDRFEVLLDAADRALYAAKADGRNRVAVAPVAP